MYFSTSHATGIDIWCITALASTRPCLEDSWCYRPDCIFLQELLVGSVQEAFLCMALILRCLLFQHPMYQTLQILHFQVRIACWVAEQEEQGTVLDWMWERKRCFRCDYSNGFPCDFSPKDLKNFRILFSFHLVAYYHFWNCTLNCSLRCTIELQLGVIKIIYGRILRP